MRILILAIIINSLFGCRPAKGPTALYDFDPNALTRWSSFENMNGVKGAGAMENNGAKGHPSEPIDIGETKLLVDVKGAGVINRIWLTVMDRSPEMLRSLTLEMFWDGDPRPAVSVPLGDFFGLGLGQTSKYHNAFFSNPEGRSFLCYIPMPFRKGARIQVRNESNRRLSHIFFDINFQELKKMPGTALYFHSYWNRDTATKLMRDFEILPRVSGRGKYLGTNIGVNANHSYKGYWWGEGEVKIYMDGDSKWPTLAGTGAEDYIGTGWGQGVFQNEYAGSLVADEKTQQWAFYRYHIPDPVYFSKECKVTIQQMGSTKKEDVLALSLTHPAMLPVTLDDQRQKVIGLYNGTSFRKLDDPTLGPGYSNFYRSDDVSATAYFYLDRTSTELPPLQDVMIRTYKLKK